MGRDISLALRYIITHILFPGVIIALLLQFIAHTFRSCGGEELPMKPDTTIVSTRHTSHYQREYRLQKVSIPAIPLYVFRIDSVKVSADSTLYREQKVYHDSTYTAFISGIDAQLDSIRTYTQVIEKIDTVFQRQEVTVTVPVVRNPGRIRWGVTAGPAITPHGFDFAIVFGATVYF